MISEGENKLILYNIIGHTRMILCHKYIVCRYCWKVGLYWQGIVHDISKFSFTEFSVGVSIIQGNVVQIAFKKVERDTHQHGCIIRIETNIIMNIGLIIVKNVC